MGIAGKIAKNVTFGFITSVSELGIAFVTVMLLTRALGPEQYGLYAYAIWLFTLACLINNVGLGEMTRRFIPEAVGRNSATEPAGIVRVALLLRIGVAVVICIAILISSGYWAQQSGSSDNYLVFIIIAFATIPESLQQGLVAIFKGFQKFDYALYVSLAMYPLRLVLIAIFMFLGFDIITVLLINVVSLVVGVLVSVFLLSRLVPLRSLFSPMLLSNERRKQALKYSITAAGIMILSYLVSQQAEVFFLGLYCTVEDVGFFTLAFKIGLLAGLLPQAVAYVLLPAITEQIGKGQIEKMKRIYPFY